MNAEAIYDTRPRPGDLWKEGAEATFADPKAAENWKRPAGENVPIRFTRTKDEQRIYAICMQWPGSELLLKTVRAKPGSKVMLLGVGQPLTWSNKADGLAIQIPEALQNEVKRPCKVAWSFRIEGAKA